MHIALARVAVIVVFFVLLGAIIYLKSKGSEEPRASGPEPAARASAGGTTPEQTLPAILEFGRGQCTMCKLMKPILDELQKELAGKVEIRIVDTSESPKEAERYKVTTIPTQIFLDSTGKELYRHEGFLPKDKILAKLKELGIQL